MDIKINKIKYKHKYKRNYKKTKTNIVFPCYHPK